MDFLTVYNSITEKVYNISKNKLECILTLRDGSVIRGEEDVVYKTNIFGYDIIDPSIEILCLENAIKSYIAKNSCMYLTRNSY